MVSGVCYCVEKLTQFWPKAKQLKITESWALRNSDYTKEKRKHSENISALSYFSHKRERKMEQ